MATHLNKEVDRLAPFIPGPMDKALFLHYDAKGLARWSNNWTRNLDFTGVAWDSSKTGTLIHPQYLVFASHFQRRIGEEVVFHDRAGIPVRRHIAAKRTINRMGDPDVALARLDRPVPDSIAVYPLLPEGPDYKGLLGAKILVTDKERKVHLFWLNRLDAFKSGYLSVGARKGLGHELAERWHERLIGGDSGNPSFLIVDGKLLLLSTLRGGGWGAKGPFFGDRQLKATLAKAMREMEAENVVRNSR